MRLMTTLALFLTLFALIGCASWRAEKANLNLVANFIASLPSE